MTRSTSEVARDPRSPPLESVGATLPGQRASTDNDSEVNEDIASLNKDVPILQELHTRAEAIRQEAAKAAAADGEAFLTDNALRPEVTVLESGLQYEVITEGTGEIPTADKQVRVHYHGELTDGTVFDSSVSRGQPAEFPVSGVIKGWTEALQIMPVGSKWRLHIPQDLAYGERGAGASIAPYSTLIFDIELLAIV